MDNHPSMSPDEMAWASQNAGRPPQARQATSEEFAARARDQESQDQQQQQRQLYAAQHHQDMQYNQAVHRQDMAAAQAQHALLGEYSVLDKIRTGLGMQSGGEFGWKQGFVAGLVVGAVVVGIFWNQKR